MGTKRGRRLVVFKEMPNVCVRHLGLLGYPESIRFPSQPKCDVPHLVDYPSLSRLLKCTSSPCCLRGFAQEYSASASFPSPKSGYAPFERYRLGGSVGLSHVDVRSGIDYYPLKNLTGWFMGMVLLFLVRPAAYVVMCHPACECCRVGGYFRQLGLSFVLVCWRLKGLVSFMHPCIHRDEWEQGQLAHPCAGLFAMVSAQGLLTQGGTWYITASVSQPAPACR